MNLFLTRRKKFGIDWIMVLAMLPILAAGLVTMHSFSADGVDFFSRQLLWIGIAFVMFFVASFLDLRFLKKSSNLLILYALGVGLLVAVALFGATIKGATSWLDFGGFSLQPADPMKLILILILAKYFSRRHVEIRNPKHVLISAAYMLIPFGLVFMQPDFGSAMIIFMVWFGMILVSGISKKHLFIMLTLGVIAGSLIWVFALRPYQKQRILSFIDPLSDIQGAGYNAYQSTIAVGSGQVIGKGLGYGTQSRLKFLPEYQTDFIFAAFAEEWGFVGAVLLVTLYGLVIWRIMRTSAQGATNFETLFGVGLAMMLMSHAFVNVGMNIGLMPVTGITLPFLSYGGSHLVTTFLGLGILMSMRRYSRVTSRADMRTQAIDVAPIQY